MLKQQLGYIFSFLLMSSAMLFFSLFLSLSSMNSALILSWEIMLLNSAPVEMVILLDPVSLSFASVVCLISSNVMLFSLNYMAHNKAYNRFFWLLLFFVISMNLLIFIPNLIALLLGWDGLGLTSFLLVIFYQNKKSLSAGMITVLANRIGDSMLLMTIGLLMSQGHWNIYDLQTSQPLVIFILLFIIIASMTKSAQMPFSSWLPAAMAAPTPVSALVHSSTLVTAGVYLLIRFYPTMHALNNPNLSTILLFIATMTMLMAGIGATFENDLKKIIALSTLSQLSVMMTAIALGHPLMALFHLYTHALFKATLFLSVGSVIHNSGGYQDIRMLSNMWKSAPLSIMIMNICSLSLCGIPFMAGFYSKDMILEAMIYSSNFSLLLLTLLATLFTVAYSFRLLLVSTHSINKAMPWKTMKMENSPLAAIPIIILTLGAIMGGSFFLSLFINLKTNTLLPNPHNLIIPLLTISTILITSALSMPSLTPKSLHSTKLTHFFSTMWLLTWISPAPTMAFNSLKGERLTKTLEFGWMETLGGQGLFAIIMQSTQRNQLWQSQLITTTGLVMFSLFLLLLTSMIMFF